VNEERLSKVAEENGKPLGRLLSEISLDMNIFFVGMVHQMLFQKLFRDKFCIFDYEKGGKSRIF
jgi:hypothetical protein